MPVDESGGMYSLMEKIYLLLPNRLDTEDGKSSNPVPTSERGDKPRQIGQVYVTYTEIFLIY